MSFTFVGWVSLRFRLLMRGKSSCRWDRGGRSKGVGFGLAMEETFQPRLEIRRRRRVDDVRVLRVFF
uniref:Uncharacterized protein n=1 Tax=Rhizophora mucronata TaxID=61149 RepID=A0A2P2JJJ5_RHIMU